MLEIIPLNVKLVRRFCIIQLLCEQLFNGGKNHDKYFTVFK